MLYGLQPLRLSYGTSLKKSNSEFTEALLYGIVPGEGKEATSRSETSSNNNRQTGQGRKRGMNVVNVSPMPCKSNYFVSDFICGWTLLKLHVYTRCRLIT